eukprot:TRINITY_DN2725_c0_g1_i1.p1 TRINITY_DN2725_c0_g1~~TRINITY_DN2725_c0_g1_i1.p1  ORF type:complete len:477 (+),score=86.51 TRINITY_DN2725_c0_g1_i1:148-1578(+)
MCIRDSINAEYGDQSGTMSSIPNDIETAVEVPGTVNVELQEAAQSENRDSSSTFVTADPSPLSQAPSESTQQSDTPNPLMACIYKIPICGGFCAPTASTEKSCLRHFSNKDTPPQPCLSSYCCRRCWEHPTPCRCMGRVGFAWADRNRSYIMLTAFCVSFISWVFCFVALAAASTETSVILDVAWARGTTALDATLHPPSGASVTSYIGINARVDVVTPTGGVSTTSTVNWDDPGACTVNGFTFPGCSSCEDTATGAISWLIVAVVTQMFQMATDLQRATRYGDLNCQKVMGIATGLFSAYTTLQSLSSFMQNCASKNNFEWFFSTSESSSASSGATSTDIKASTGFVLLFMATVLKLFDVVCHVIVPTPVQKHGYMPAEGCEGPSLEGYMQECAQECEWGKPIEHAPDSPSLLVDGPTSAAPAQEAPEVTLDSKPVEAPEPMAGSLTIGEGTGGCLLYTSPSPRDRTRSRMPSSA